jgi:hypothetical protein
MRAMLVEMGGVLAQHRAKVPFAEDQDPVGAFDQLGGLLHEYAQVT